MHKEQLHASKMIFVIRVTIFLRVGEILSSSFKEFQTFGPWYLKAFSPYLVVITLGCTRINSPRKLRDLLLSVSRVLSGVGVVP